MINSLYKEICEYGKTHGLSVFGAIRVPYPVWVLHLKMKSKDMDPFFPIDRSILRMIQMQQNTDFSFVANLIGMEYDFTDWRRKELLEAGMIQNHDGCFFVTDNGLRKYIESAGERGDVVVYDDFVVDGVSYLPLDKTFYTSKATYRDRRDGVISPAVPMGIDDPKLLKAIKIIERLNGNEKEEYKLEGSSHDYEILGYELQSIDNVYIVFSFDESQKTCRRDIFFKDQFISKIDALSSIKDRYYYYFNRGECHSSDGFEPKDGEPVVYFTQTQISLMLSQRYLVDMDEVNEKDYTYNPNAQANGGWPLLIHISDSLLERSGNPQRLINDAINGFFDLTVKENTISNRKGRMIRQGGFYQVKVDNTIADTIKRFKALKDWIKEHGSIDAEFVKAYYGDGKDWRRDFIRLGLFEELEKIDMSQFIKYYNDNQDDEE